MEAHHEDRLISGVAATVAGRFTAGWRDRDHSAGIPVTVAVTCPNPKDGADLRRTYAGTGFTAVTTTVTMQ